MTYPYTEDEISRKVPFISGVTPNNNEFTINDLQRAGGIPALMNELSVHLNLDTLTVTGSTVRENIEGSEVLDREIIYTLEKPIDHDGGIAVLKGSRNWKCADEGR